MVLRARGIVVRHHPSLPATLDGVDLDVAAGEVVVVVGSNGSGKSTLARALVGLVQLERGQVTGASGGAPRVGLVLQDPAAQLVAVTVADEVALGPESQGMRPAVVADRVLSQLRLQDLEPLHHRDPATLSGGQQQRVAVAAIGSCDVDVLVLDEPTAMLDAAATSAFGDRIRDLAAGRAVVWVTQEAADVASADRVVVLDAGTVAWQGSGADYVAQPSLAAGFGLELPPAARIAHELAAHGAWPATRPIPVRLPDLVQGLASRG